LVPLSLEEIWRGVQAHSVDAHVEPEVARLEHRFLDARVVVVEVGLMREEAVPVVRAGHVVPRPVGDLEVLEDDAGVLVFLVGLAPHV